MENAAKQDLKIKLKNHFQYLTAWDLLAKLGYHCETTPHTAQYLYAHPDGHIGVDYFDDEGADSSNPDSTLGYFNNHKNKEYTFAEFVVMAREQGQESYLVEIMLVKQERQAFEENYVQCGGKLLYLTWEECADGTGSYQRDWDAIREAGIFDSEFESDMEELASHVTGCLHSWVQCAKAKAAPQGYYLMPIQPSEEMLKQAELEFQGLDIKDIQDRIVFSHQAMIQVLCQSPQ